MMLMDCTLLYTHTCPVTEFAVASHLNTANSERSVKQINLQAAGKCGILLIVMRSAFF